MERKYIKYFIFILFCLLFFFIPNKIYASTEYVITDYDISMIVNENNTFDITEVITVYFYTGKHGITREIPLKNTITRTDGTTSTNNAGISNISVSETYTTSKSVGNYVLKIGDSDKTITGTHEYIISYTYNIGKDPLEEEDELYFNLIGDDWDTSINNVRFTITMPKEFDSSTLGFSSRTSGSTDGSNVTYTVNGNVISGSTNDVLSSGEALTVRLTLPEGYFVGASSNIDVYPIFSIIVCVIFVIIAFCIWKKYGKDDEVVAPVQLYPPEGYNSAEIAYMYEGRETNQGVVSLLIYLADKGYIKIIEAGGTHAVYSNLNKITIVKLKEYDGNNENEKMFLDGLFKAETNWNYGAARNLVRASKARGEKISFNEALQQTSTVNEKQSVTTLDLHNSFYTTVNRIRTNIKQSFKNQIFEKSLPENIMILVLMIIIIFCNLMYDFADSIYEGIMYAIFFGMIFVVMILPCSKYIVENKSVGGTIILIICFLFIVLPIYLYMNLYLYTTYNILRLIETISIMIIVFLIELMPKRTSFGNEMLSKIKGFKNFLEIAEKQQLEALVHDNPEYFYNILPYTYALGVSDEWMKQFESISMKAPDWFTRYR